MNLDHDLEQPSRFNPVERRPDGIYVSPVTVGDVLFRHTAAAQEIATYGRLDLLAYFGPQFAAVVADIPDAE